LFSNYRRGLDLRAFNVAIFPLGYRMKVHITYLKKDGESWSHIEDFKTPPRIGEFIVIGVSGQQAYQIVQVVHSRAQHEDVSYCATARQSPLSHAVNLKSEDAK
jgi:hypothetical protein